MKRFLAGFVTAAVLFSVAPSFAQETIRLVVNGVEVAFTDATPQIINGYTMVPARPLAEALGADVRWNEISRAVIVTSKPIETTTSTRAEPPAKKEKPLTVIQDGVTYYEYYRLTTLLTEKYPETYNGYGSEGYYLGFTRYHAPGIMWNRYYFYVDVRGLLESGIITQEDLNVAFASS